MKKLLGGHVSAAGGPHMAVERAAAIGGNAVQIFSGSPRVWARPALESVDAEKVFSKQKELGVEAIITHSIYLLNLASENPESVRKSIDVLKFDMKFNVKLKGQGIVVHVGSSTGRGWDAVKEQTAKNIAEVMAASPKESYFLIENAASQNGKIGGTLDEVRWLIDTVKADNLGWCFDTCHGFAGAYYLGKPGEKPDGESLKGQTVQSAIEEIERLKLHDTLRCVHVNDSRDPFASGRDRHDNLGEGNIDQSDLKYFLNHELIKDKILILEVPGENKEGPDKANMDRLKKLVGEE